MWKYTIALLFIVLMTGSGFALNEGQASVGDPYFPGIGNTGYDALHYDLDIDVDFSTETLSATVKILIQATEDLSQFNLDFGGFKISSVNLNGDEVEYSRDGLELTIYPDNLIAKDETFTVTISYAGKPREDLDTSKLYIASPGWVFHDKGSLVVSEPQGASLWYPVNDHPTDKATYNFEITVPNLYVVAANGLLLDKVIDGDKTTYKWQSENRIASYLVTVNIGQYVVQQTHSKNGILIRNYFPPQYLDQTGKTFANVADMVDFYEGIIGDYPFEAYGGVVSDTELPFALETQTLTTFGTRVLNPTSVTEITMAHELAHQWFGDSVSVATWRDIWLNEGFASYLSLLWAEKFYGKPVFNSILHEWYDTITDPDFLAESPLIGDPGPAKMFHGAVYLKGAWTLHALRLAVGDEVFFDILRTYYDRFKDGNASIADFISLSEDLSGQDLKAFFDSWLYAKTVPSVPGF